MNERATEEKDVDGIESGTRTGRDSGTKGGTRRPAPAEEGVPAAEDSDPEGLEGPERDRVSPGAAQGEAASPPEADAHPDPDASPDPAPSVEAADGPTQLSRIPSEDGPRTVASPAPRERPGRRMLSITRPGDGTPVGEVRVATEREVLEAVERGRSAQRAWVGLEAEERFRRLRPLVREVGERADEIASLIRDETGKPRIEGLAEVLLTVDLLKYYMEVAPRILRRQWVRTTWLIGKSAYTYREPYGVVGAITPWNYPFLLPMDAVAAALFSGNAIVLKPSEHTPFSALKVAELVRDAGLGEGLVEVVPGDGSTGETLVRAGVDKIFFTGSSGTGRKVMAAAAETLTPVALELGGKDPAIVLEDADLDRAARGIVYGAFFNAGQTCISTERVFVMKEVYDDLVERIIERTEALRVGTEGEYDVGPLTTSEQLGVVEEQVRDALERGATVATGGERLAPDSRCYRPTVLVDVDQSMRVLWEETFGPLLPVMPVESEDEAVRMVNVSPFGLFASVWTEDRDRGERVGERLRCGGVSINDTLSHYAVPGLPMGGTGESGFGRRRGVAGLEEMSRSRSVLVHRTGLNREIWWFPYTDRAYRLVRALLDYRQSSGLGRVWNGLRRLLSRGGRTPG